MQVCDNHQQSKHIQISVFIGIFEAHFQAKRPENTQGDCL